MKRLKGKDDQVDFTAMRDLIIAATNKRNLVACVMTEIGSLTWGRRIILLYRGGSSCHIEAVGLDIKGTTAVVGIGDVYLITKLGEKLVLKGVRHIPSLCYNLFR